MNRQRSGALVERLSRCGAPSPGGRNARSLRYDQDLPQNHGGHSGGLEFWYLRESPNLVGADAKADIPLPANVRRYFFPGTSHGGGRGGFSSATPAPPTAACCPPTRTRRRRL